MPPGPRVHPTQLSSQLIGDYLFVSVLPQPMIQDLVTVTLSPAEIQMDYQVCIRASEIPERFKQHGDPMLEISATDCHFVVDVTIVFPTSRVLTKIIKINSKRCVLRVVEDDKAILEEITPLDLSLETTIPVSSKYTSHTQLPSPKQRHQNRHEPNCSISMPCSSSEMTHHHFSTGSIFCPKRSRSKKKRHHTPSPPLLPSIHPRRHLLWFSVSMGDRGRSSFSLGPTSSSRIIDDRDDDDYGLHRTFSQSYHLHSKVTRVGFQKTGKWSRLIRNMQSRIETYGLRSIPPGYVSLSRHAVERMFERNISLTQLIHQDGFGLRAPTSFKYGQFRVSTAYEDDTPPAPTVLPGYQARYCAVQIGCHLEEQKPEAKVKYPRRMLRMRDRDSMFLIPCKRTKYIYEASWFWRNS